MFPVFYRTIMGTRLEQSSESYQNWGIVLNGVCLTARALECRSNDTECTLWDVLNPDAPEKYFLSPAMREKVLTRLSEGHRVTECTQQTEQPSPNVQEAEAEEDAQVYIL